MVIFLTDFNRVEVSEETVSLVSRLGGALSSVFCRLFQRT